MTLKTINFSKTKNIGFIAGLLLFIFVPKNDAYAQNISGVITSCDNLSDVVNVLNSSTLVGHTIFEIPSSYSGEPSYPIIFEEFTTDGVDDWTVTVRPELGATNFLTTGVSGTNTPLIILDGIDRLTIDGRPGGTGNDLEWTFRATSNSASAFRFRNDAQHNTLTYLNAESRNASNTSSNLGTINFHEGNSLGNSFNTISYCEIKDIDGNSIQPDVGIYSMGEQWNIRNEGNEITHNKIYNFRPNSTSTAGREVAGILIENNNSDWIINNNHIYQTSVYVQPIISAHEVYHVFYGIKIDWSSNTGGGYQINDNFIGGSEPNAGGLPWEVDWDPGMSLRVGNLFYGIHLNTSDALYSEIQGNTISNFNWKSRQGSGVNWHHSSATSDPTWTGIYLARGNYNVGTTSGNQIGQDTGVDDIIVDTRLSSCVAGIYAQSPSNRGLNIANNKVGSITIDSPLSNQYTDFIGIGVDYASDGSSNISEDLTISNNLVGSETTPKSINCNAEYSSSNTTGSQWASQQYTVGIWVMRAGSSTFDVDILNNTVANMYNNAKECGRPANNFMGIRGIIITTSRGLKTVSNNRVFNLGGTVYTVGATPDRCFANTGIFTDQTVGPTIISSNEVFGLYHEETVERVNIAGLFTNNGGSNSEVYKNIIHSLSLSTSSTSESFIHGIDIWNTRAIYHNNMIRLGIDRDGNAITNGYTINGIYFRQPNGNRTTKIYFNTLYVGGETVNLGSSSTSTFFNASTRTDNSNIFKNNIFKNERSGSGEHFAVTHQVLGGLETDYNHFRASGTNGVLTKLAGVNYPTLNDWQSAVGDDANSITGEVFFVNKNGDATQVDLHIDTSVTSIIQGAGEILAEVDFDIDDDWRYGHPSSSSPGPGPDIGADEITGAISTLPVELTYFITSCLDDNEVVLNWQTASEINASHFVIEKSRNGEYWTAVGEISASGNSNTTKNYKFNYQQNSASLAYYRLVQFDYNGEYEVFGPISSVCKGGEFSLVLYPNPAQNQIHLNINSSYEIYDLEINIFDATGKVVKTKSINSLKSGLSTFDISDIENGTYFLRFCGENIEKECVNKKFVISR